MSAALNRDRGAAFLEDKLWFPSWKGDKGKQLQKGKHPYVLRATRACVYGKALGEVAYLDDNHLTDSLAHKHTVITQSPSSWWMWGCMYVQLSTIEQVKKKLHTPQIPPQSRACAGRLCSPSFRSASGSSPARAGVPSCASPPPGRPVTARRWPRTAGGYTAAPGACWERRRRAGAAPGAGSDGTCPPSWPCLRSWGSPRCSPRSTGAPSAPHAASPPRRGQYTHGRSLSWTSPVWRWKTSHLLQSWAPLKPFTGTKWMASINVKLTYDKTMWIQFPLKSMKPDLHFFFVLNNQSAVSWPRRLASTEEEGQTAGV